MSERTSGGHQVRFSYGGGTAPSQKPPLQPKQEELQHLQARALGVARAFEPKRAVGLAKVRIGRSFDGGYILLDDFAGVGAALSFGIADDVSWDLQMAARNIPVHQFDHTVDRPPVEHPLFHFHKQQVAAVDGPNAQSLDSIATRCLAGCERAILKIDIEGQEWEVFQSASPATLDQFSQIVCEFHGLDSCGDPGLSGLFQEALAKLRMLFEVVHVHGNNNRPFASIGNVVLPTLLEVTFASRRHYRFTETNEIFPTDLDRPNMPQAPDMWLGCFKF